MKNCKHGVALFACVSLSLLSTGEIFAQETVNPGVVRVKFTGDAVKAYQHARYSKKDGGVISGESTFDAVSTKLGVYSIKPIFQYNPKYAERHRKHGLDRWFELRYDEKSTPASAVSAFSNLSGVEIAEPSYKIKVIGNDSPSKVITAQELADDPYLAKQWHYNNPGGGIGLAGSDINLGEAWQIQTGDPEVIVSIVDGGIDTSHPDLKNNLWTNRVEFFGTPGVDDDGNGYIDDINGYNFADDKPNVTAHDHGTHVAGTVAATNNNGLGVAGVAGGSGNEDGIRMISCQIFSENNSAGHANALVYGADNGAVISQNSWGYETPGYYEQLVNDAIDYFVEEAGQYEGSPMKGGIAIFASGNNGDDNYYYPAAYERCLSVSAIGPDYKAATYTNRGGWVTLSAPGGDYMLGSEWAVLSTLPNSKYGYMDGTSMACPHVSGIAALVVSQYKGRITNDELFERLKTATHSLDTYNPEYKGRLGTGYIDAALALSENKGIAPSVVSDFGIDGASQDFVSLSWTAVSDEDDSHAYNYDIFYDTKPFTAGSLSIAKSIKGVGLNIAQGENITHQINNLLPQTTYYFAVRANDRWGNSSPLSDILEAKTNEGPSITLDDTDIQLDFATGEQTSGDAAFWIVNDGEGVLNWNTIVRHANHKYNTTMTKASKSPVVLNKSGEATTLGTMTLAAADDYVLADDVNEGKKISYGVSQDYLIGDVDENKSNSMITYYYTDEGFNLTSISALLRHDPAKGPVQVRIYEGSVLSPDAIIYEQEYKGYTENPAVHEIVLDEQVYFEPYSTFYVEIHVPEGNRYPLGIALENNHAYSNYSFYSTDGGKSGKSLESVMTGSFEDPYVYVWDMTLKSSNGWFGNYLAVDQPTGTLAAHDSTEIKVNANGGNLINGTYTAHVIIESNDSEQPLVKKPVKVTMKGHKAEITSRKVVDFNSVLIGERKFIDVEIKNVGLGHYTNYQTTSSNKDFSVVTDAYSVGALSNAVMRIRYTPTVAGPQSSSITMNAADGSKYTFSVGGVGVEGGHVAISKDTINLETIDAKSSLNQTISFELSNDGGLPVEYAIGKLAPELSEGLDTLRVNRLGYRTTQYLSKQNAQQPADFKWIDISEIGQDMIDEVPSPKDYKKLDLGFKFPFYDKVYDELYLNQATFLATADTVTFGNCMPATPNAYCMLGYGAISLGASVIASNPASHIWVHGNEERFVVTYENVRISTYNGNMTAQIVLYPSGDIRLAYKEIDVDLERNAGRLFIGLTDDFNEDPTIIATSDYPFDLDNNVWTNDLFSYSYFDLSYPGKDMAQSSDQATGLLQVGETKTVTLDLKASGLSEGAYHQNLPIFFGNMQNPVTYLRVQGEIVGGGESKVVLKGENEINLGQIYRTKETTHQLRIDNEGTAAANLEVSQDNGLATFLDSKDIYTVLPQRSTHIHFSLNTEKIGDYAENIKIKDGDKEIAVKVTYQVLAEPDIKFTPENLKINIDGGTTESQQITVVNEGSSDLNLSMVDNSAVYLKDYDLTAQSKNSYHVLRNDEGEMPPFHWEDIQADAQLHKTVANRIEENVNNFKIDLPFEFTFYGKKYSSLYVHYMGLLSFQPYPEADDALELVPLPIIPTKDGYDNIIAPMAGTHQPNYQADQRKTGIFYYHTPDYVVIEFANYIDAFFFAPDNYSFQVHLYKNGVIKFQYKNTKQSFFTTYTVGIENAEADQSTALANGVPILDNDMAISFMPVKNIVVPAKEEKVIDLVVDATTLQKGSYNADLLIESNVPKAESTVYPIKLEVEGSPAIVHPDTINFGEEMIVWEESPYDPYYGKVSLPVGISNKGFAPDTILSITTSGKEAFSGTIKFVDPMFGMSMNLPFSDYEGMPKVELAAGQSLDASIYVMSYESGVHSDVLTVTTTVGTYEIPIKATLISSPSASLALDSINVVAKGEGFETTESVVLANTSDETALTYKANLQYKRSVKTVLDDLSLAQTHSAGVAAPLSNIPSKGIATYATDDDSFNREISYNELGISPTNYLGFGADLGMILGVQFTAPEDGLNISHIRTWYMNGAVLESKIKVRVLAGSDMISFCEPIAQGEATIVKDQEDYQGSYQVIELDEAIHLYPHEQVFIELTFDIGVEYPQGYVSYNNSADVEFGRYFYSDGQLWADVAESGLPMVKPLVSLLEETYQKDFWVAMDEVEGSVEPSSEKNLELRFQGELAPESENIARVVFTTNDPYNSEMIIPIKMTKNQGPAIHLEKPTYHVEEGQSIVINFTVDDLEGDSYSLNGDFPEFMSLEDIESAKHSLKVFPTHEDAGIYNVTLEATDSYDATSTSSIFIEVVNVNRTPEAVSKESLQLTVNQFGQEEVFSDFFNDADLDEMTYEVTKFDPSYLRIYDTETSFVAYGLQAGNTSITLTGTDSHGASATCLVDVVISGSVGIDDAQVHDIRINPSTVKDVANLVNLDQYFTAEVYAKIYDAAGACVLDVKLAPGDDQLQVSHLTAGVYFVTVYDDSQIYQIKMVKE